MIRVQVMPRKGIKMMKLKANREHRKFHIEKAEAMRVEAKAWHDAAIQYADAAGFNAKDEIEDAYINMLAEAVAEENRKCMEGQH